MSSLKARAKPLAQTRFLAYVEFPVYLAILFLCVGEPVPGINESHYLPKALHLWDASFAPGDLFLASHDSHFLASMLAGIPALVLPLPAVAWLGRLLSWTLLALAWGRLSRALSISPVVSAFALITWLLGVRYGHWAGEWVVGGFEAKTIAYPLVVFGLANLVVGRWSLVWIWMGAAMAWHPLAGGWAGLSAGLLWLISVFQTRPAVAGENSTGQSQRQQLAQQLPWLAIGGGVGLIGVLPAAFGLGGPDVIDKISAAKVHVYARLPHHLAPHMFAIERHYAAILSLAVLALATWLLGRRLAALPLAARDTERGLQRLLGVAWLAVGFALIGLAVDLLLSTPRSDIVAASWLRFYWFRWADVAVPLASSLCLWHCCWCSFQSGLAINQPRPGFSLLSKLPLSGAMILTTLVVLLRLDWSDRPQIPAADRLLVLSRGPNQVHFDRYPDDPLSARYTDWLAVCQWIRENTPEDSLWFTPKYQQSFKWHAQRAEVYCWKDVPQDNASVVEWYRRVQKCQPPRNTEGEFRDWTTEELLSLSREYGFRWVLLDRTFQREPPALELMYPVAPEGYYIDNRSFAVFRIPDALVRP